VRRTNLRLAGKIVASLIVTGVCVAYAVHGVDRGQVLAELRHLTAGAVLTYLGTLAISQTARRLHSLTAADADLVGRIHGDPGAAGPAG
jgi:hypothetical protein